MTPRFVPVADRFAVILFLALCLGLIGATVADEPAKEDIRYIRAVLDSATSKQIFYVDGEEIRDAESLKVFVTELPKGSILRWDSGCIKYETFPMIGPEVKILDFKSFCEKQGVQFRYIYGY